MVGINVFSKSQMNQVICSVIKNWMNFPVCVIDSYELILSGDSGDIGELIDVTQLYEIMEGKHNFFISARCFFYKDKNNITQMRDIRDYLQSECQVVMLVIDALYLEIYAKDSDMLNKCIANLRRDVPNSEIELINQMERKSWLI